MKKITNIRKRILKVEEDAKKLHQEIFQAFKEVADKKNIDYAAHLKNDYFYSIPCGTYYAGFYPYEIFYNDGQIELWRMKFGTLNYKIAEWKTIEDFKKEVIGRIEK